MTPASRSWVDTARGHMIWSSTPRSQVDVNTVRKAVDLGVIPPPPVPKDVSFVLRGSEFKVAGSAVVEDNGYTSTKLMREWRVDFSAVYRKLIAKAPKAKKYKRFLGCLKAW